MATRFWLTNTAAPYTPATRRGTWAVTSSTVARLAGPRPTGASTTQATAVGSTAANRDVFLGRWISGAAVTAGTLSGTVSWVIGFLESAAGLNGFAKVHIYVTAGDSDTVRGTALNQAIGGTEFGTTYAGMAETALALSSVAVSVGDRLVIEVGYRASAGGTGQTGTVRYGGTGAPLTAGATNTALAPWVELSDGEGLFSNAVSDLVSDFATMPSAFASGGYGSVAPAVSGGRLQLQPSGVTDDYTGVSTPSTYQLDTAGVYAELIPPDPTGATTTAYVAMSLVDAVAGGGLYLGAQIDAETGFLALYSWTAFDDPDAVYLTFDPVAHRWVWIHRSGTSIVWETSANGSAWTVRRTLTTAPTWTSYLDLSLLIESYKDGTSGVAEADNLNNPPPASPLQDLGPESIDAVDNVVAVAAPPNLEDLQYDYSGDLPSPYVANSYGGVTITGGRLRVTCASAGGGLPAYAGAVMRQPGDWDWTEPIAVKWWPAAHGGATGIAQTETLVSSPTPGTDIGFLIEASDGDALAPDGTLVMASRVGYVDAGRVEIPFDPVAHLWIMWGPDGLGDFVWKTSPDGTTWTTQRTITAPAWVTAGGVYINQNAWREDGTANFAEWDDLNLQPASADLQADAGPDPAGLVDAAAAVLDLARTAGDTAEVTDATTAAASTVRTAADTGELADTAAAAAALTRSLTDSADAGDTAAAALTAARTLADTAELADTAAAARDLPRAAGDGAELADTAAAVLTTTRTAGPDVAELVDTAAAAEAFTRTPADTADGSDQVAAVVTAVRTATDTAEVTDATTAAADRPRSAADTADAGDTASVIKLATRETSDVADAGDQVVRVATTVRTAADEAAIADGVSIGFAGAEEVTVPDTVEVTDTVATAAAAVRQVGPDGADLADQAAAERSAPRTAADAGDLADTVTVVVTAVRGQADDAGIGDGVQVATSGADEASVSDTIETADQATTTATAVRSAGPDSADLTDSAAAVQGIARGPADGADLGDTAAAVTSAARTAADTGELVDAVTAAAARARTATDAGELVDAVATTAAAVRGAADAGELVDAVSADLAEVLQAGAGPDPVELVDAVQVVAGPLRLAADVADLADLVATTAAAVRAPDDGAGVEDLAEHAVAAGRPVSDVAELVDGVQVQYAGNGETGLSDQVDTVDAAARTVTAVRAAADDAGTGDAVVAERVAPRTAADTVEGADQLARVAVVVRETSSAAGLGDAVDVVYAASGETVVTDAALIGDGTAHTVSAVRAAADVGEVVDAAATALARPRTATDAAATADAVSTQLTRQIDRTDSAALADQVATAAVRARQLDDAGALVDAIAISGVSTAGLADAGALVDEVFALLVLGEIEQVVSVGTVGVTGLDVDVDTVSAGVVLVTTVPKDE